MLYGKFLEPFRRLQAYLCEPLLVFDQPFGAFLFVRLAQVCEPLLDLLPPLLYFLVSVPLLITDGAAVVPILFRQPQRITGGSQTLNPVVMIFLQLPQPFL